MNSRLTRAEAGAVSAPCLVLGADPDHCPGHVTGVRNTSRAALPPPRRLGAHGKRAISH